MKIYKEIKQNTEEWHELRKGKMTASHAQAIGNAGRGLTTYLWEVVANRHAIQTDFEGYSSAAMEQGKEREAVARSVFEIKTGKRVEEVGFVEMNEFCGCSPDGFVCEEKSGLEIKCPSNKTYFKHLVTGDIEKKYLWQVQMSLLVCEMKTWYLVFFNPNFNQHITITEVKRDEEMIEKIKAGIEKGINKIKQIEEKLNQ